MFAIIKLAGFLRRDQCAGQAQHLNHLLHDEFIPQKILQVGHGQSFRGQNLFDKFIHRHWLTAAAKGTEKITGSRDQRIFADINAELFGFRAQQETDVNPLLRFLPADAGVFVRPLAVVHPGIKVKFRLRALKFLRRDWVTVNRAVTSTDATAAVARRAGAHENHKGNNREAGDDPPQPARMFAN